MILFFSELLRSVSFVFKKHLYLYFLPAVGLSILFYLSFKGGSGVANWLSFMEDWWVVGWLVKTLESIISAVSFMLFEFFILVLLTPINSILAEKMKEEVTGVKAVFSVGQLVRSVGRSIAIFAYAFTFEMMFLLVIWVFSFILGDWVSYWGGLLISSYFIGFSFYDFALELDFKSSKNSWQWGKQNKALVLVAGLLFSFSIYIPEESGWLGLYVISISIVPHLLVLATTATYYKNKENVLVKPNSNG